MCAHVRPPGHNSSCDINMDYVRNANLQHDWLLVSNIFYFSISYMGCRPSHWRTHIFQDGYCTTNQIILPCFTILTLLIPTLASTFDPLNRTVICNSQMCNSQTEHRTVERWTPMDQSSNREVTKNGSLGHEDLPRINTFNRGWCYGSIHFAISKAWVQSFRGMNIHLQYQLFWCSPVVVALLQKLMTIEKYGLCEHPNKAHSADVWHVHQQFW